jgi:frataxin-like iron-binding protein CyaY
MARVRVELTKDVWTSLGVGENVITIHKAGKGRLLINQQEDDDAALPITRDRPGDQIINNEPTDEIWVKPSEDGWEVVKDLKL